MEIVSFAEKAERKSETNEMKEVIRSPVNILA